MGSPRVVAAQIPAVEFLPGNDPELKAAAGCVPLVLAPQMIPRRSRSLWQALSVCNFDFEVNFVGLQVVGSDKETGDIHQAAHLLDATGCQLTELQLEDHRARFGKCLLRRLVGFLRQRSIDHRQHAVIGKGLEHRLRGLDAHRPDRATAMSGCQAQPRHGGAACC